MGAYSAETEHRVHLFSVDALNDAGSNAPETAIVAVGGAILEVVSARLLLEDRHLAVGF